MCTHLSDCVHVQIVIRIWDNGLLTETVTKLIAYDEISLGSWGHCLHQTAEFISWATAKHRSFEHRAAHCQPYPLLNAEQSFGVLSTCFICRSWPPRPVTRVVETIQWAGIESEPETTKCSSQSSWLLSPSKTSYSSSDHRLWRERSTEVVPSSRAVGEPLLTPHQRQDHHHRVRQEPSFRAREPAMFVRVVTINQSNSTTLQPTHTTITVSVCSSQIWISFNNNILLPEFSNTFHCLYPVFKHLHLV